MADVTVDNIIERIKPTSMWTVLKALPFNGGPSATKWVYLCGTFVVCLVFALIGGSFAFTYAHAHEHIANPIVAGVIVSLAATIVGFTSNSANQRRATYAQASVAVPSIPPATPVQ